MRRTVVLCVALLFIGGFAVLTIVAVRESGFTPASAISVFVLALLAVGILGALRHPPD